MSLEFDLPPAVDVAVLARHLTQPEMGVLRAKGIVRDADGKPIALHVVGQRFEIDAAPAGVVPGVLVVIGLRNRLDRAALTRCIGAMAEAGPAY